MVNRRKTPKTFKMLGRDVKAPDFKPRLENSYFTIESEQVSSDGSEVFIVARHSVSISTAGRTANRMSPGSYVTHKQTATLQKTGDGWKVMRFTDKVVPKS